jgi:hypothetical protein
MRLPIWKPGTRIIASIILEHSRWIFETGSL